jgi:mono/diheme cytochrome c family protein
MNNTMVGVLRVLLYTTLTLVLFAYVPSSVSSERDIRNSIALGAMAFSENCQRCHQADGYGEEALYPSLHNEELLADRSLLIRTILDGRSRHEAGSSDGTTPLMPSLDYLTDKEIAAIVAFISNSWGNDVLILSESEVAAARRKSGKP